MTDECEHSWDTDEEVRICGRCGQVRTFPRGEENPRILWPGRGAELDPLQLPKADKELIALAAKAYNLNRLAKLTGIPMFNLRGWVGAFGRDKADLTAQEEAPATPTTTTQEVLTKPRKKRLIGRYYEQNKELMISDYKSMTLKSFFHKWGISSPTWMKLRTLWGVPKKGRARTERVPAPQAPSNPDSKSMEEEIAELKIEAAESRGYRQAVRDIFGV